jgi:GNAT superfamily N-acetyltransferase
MGVAEGPLAARVGLESSRTALLPVSPIHRVQDGQAEAEEGSVEFAVRLTDVADESIRKAVQEPLVAYNQAKTGRNDYKPLVLAVEGPDGRVLGGLWGRTAYDWLFVELLFVPESLRGRGLGADLMLRAEAEAVARGCHGAWLDTFAFQARGFYERLGYSCFGELNDYPVGSARYFMKKTLVPE